jgi:hypothetical protein
MNFKGLAALQRLFEGLSRTFQNAFKDLSGFLKAL